MTVLASLYILFSSVVPQTSYLKSVDIWFLFNLTYPFCLIVLNVLIQNMKQNNVKLFANVRDGNEENEWNTKKIDWEKVLVIVGEVVLPIMALVFVITYFACYV